MHSYSIGWASTISVDSSYHPARRRGHSKKRLSALQVAIASLKRRSQNQSSDISRDLQRESIRAKKNGEAGTLAISISKSPFHHQFHHQN